MYIMKGINILSATIAFVLLFFCLQTTSAQHIFGTSGTNYYIDSVNGNDVNTGLSPSVPWQSLTNVNKNTFLPGDSILFECGCTWSGITLHPLGSGSSGNPIVVSKYGVGNLPQINGNTAKLQTTQAVFLSNQEYFTISNLDITNNYQSMPVPLESLSPTLPWE